MRKQFAILAYRQFVNGGEQKPVAARVCHISAVGRKIEAICDRRTVDDLRIKRSGIITSDVAQALGPHVAGLEGKAAAGAHVEFGLQSVVISTVSLWETGPYLTRCVWSSRLVSVICALPTASWVGSFTTPMIPPNMDCPMAHGAANNAANISIDILANI